MKPEGLTTYCGGFCGTCARCTRYTAFREAATLLAELADAHGFHHWLSDVVRGFDYAEFRKGLDFFADSESWLICKNACKGGTGGPPFCVRECCRQHDVDICFECSGFPCDKTKPFEGIIKEAEKHERLGREEWVRCQAEKASQGYEHHAGKYYQVWSSTTPPKN